MDNELLHIDESGEEAIQSKMAGFIKNIDPMQVSDDKTIVAIINDSAEVSRQPEEYYAEPDWEALKENYEKEWRRQAYPDLFKEEKENGSNGIKRNKMRVPFFVQDYLGR